MKVAFRVDACVSIGGGHLSRCLTLADELKKISDVECFFILKEHKGNFFEQLLSKGYKYKVIPLEYTPNYSNGYSEWVGGAVVADAKATIKFLNDEGFSETDWLIVDHYGLDSEYETVIANSGIKVGVIDDLVNRKHQCEFLLDQTCGRLNSEYSELVNSTTQLFMGEKYCILRPEFKVRRVEAKLKRFEFDRIRKVFINFGSTDPTNVTSNIVEVLNDLPVKFDIKLVIAVGSNAPYLEQINQAVARSKYPVDLYIDTQNMSSLMIDSDIAIGAAGATTWERCALGLPSVIIKTAENQSTVIERVIEEGVGVPFDINCSEQALELKKCFELIRENYQGFVKKCFDLVDGEGVDKVVNFMVGNK